MEPDRQQAIELIERADLLIAGGHSEEARGFLEHALEVDPLNVEAKRMLAGVAVREARARGEDTSNLPEQAELAALEADDLRVITRRERAMGNDQLADALQQRMVDLGARAAGSAAVRHEEDDYSEQSVSAIDPIFTRQTSVKPATPPAAYSPVGVVVWFIIGAIIGAIALYGGLFIPALPVLHKTLNWTPSMELGACGGLGLLSALLLGRSRPVE